MSAMDARTRRIQRMLADPELGGDLLLCGLVMAAHVDLGFGGRSLLALAKTAWPHESDQTALGRAKRTLADDSRRYRPPEPESTGCDAPMSRRARCGQRPGRAVMGLITDWSTGERQWLQACSRHREWADARFRENTVARPPSPPLPPANSGGVLARHLPTINWPRLWSALDPTWAPHPEPADRPALHLVHGVVNRCESNGPHAELAAAPRCSATTVRMRERRPG